MPINLVTSYIIGGLLLLSLGWVNFNISQNSNDIVLSKIQQQSRTDITEIIKFDFPKIGYQRGGGLDSTIIVAEENRIVFYSNLDNSADGSIEKVSWKYTDEEVTGTPNANDRILQRWVDGNRTDINQGVSRFRLSYYSRYGNDIPMSLPITGSRLDSIYQVEVELVLESAEKLYANKNSEGNYALSAWVKRFSPRNLNLER